MKQEVKVTDELLRNALLQAALEEAQRAQDTDEAKKPWRVSEAYAAWERDVLPNISAISAQKSASPKRRSRSWGQVAACFALTLSLSFGGLMLASPTARAAVLRWVSTWYEDHVSVLFQGEQQEDVSFHWYPSYLPEGYVETAHDALVDDVYYTFTNAENGAWIELNYLPMRQGLSFQTDNEDKLITDILVNGMHGTQMASTTKEKPSVIFWMDDESGYAFMLSSYESCEVLLRVAESVTPAS